MISIYDILGIVCICTNCKGMHTISFAVKSNWCFHLRYVGRYVALIKDMGNIQGMKD